MRSFGIAVDVTIGVLLFDLVRGKLDAESPYRAGVAFALSFMLMMLVVFFRKPKASRR